MLNYCLKVGIIAHFLDGGWVGPSIHDDFNQKSCKNGTSYSYSFCKSIVVTQDVLFLDNVVEN